MTAPKKNKREPIKSRIAKALKIESMTAPEIARCLSAGGSTVSGALAEMRESGIVIPCRDLVPSGGRRSRVWILMPRPA